MKNSVYIIIIFSFIAIFAIATTPQNKNLEVIVETRKIENQDTIGKLISEFNQMGDVMHVEAAQSTNTFMIIFKKKQIAQKRIKDVFSKWGCENIEISYDLIN